MKKLAINLSLFAATLTCFAATPLYHNDFESAAVGSQPDGFLVIDGQFAVREFAGGKVFELPGAPLDTFGFIFGPNITFNEAGNKFRVIPKPGETNDLESVVVTARAFGTKKGRRYPTFSVGLCGVAGFKLRVAPMKRAVELVRGDDTVASVERDFASGTWTYLKLEVHAADGKWFADGKVWKEGEAEPAGWQVSYSTTEKPNPGKASAWAAPFSGEPIRFDDLSIESVGK